MPTSTPSALPPTLPALGAPRPPTQGVRHRVGPKHLVLWLTLLAAVPGLALAQTAAHERATPLSTSFGFETVRLPGNERMGLLGGSLLLEAAPGWWLGPAVYGAASGERGGLFVGGAEMQRRWRFGSRQLVAGLFAGGGGGASAPVGGGLMLRPALTLLQDLGPLQAGLSWSQVRFPSGNIGSSQLGVVLAWDGVFRHADVGRAGAPVGDPGRSGVGVDRLLATVGSYRLRDGITPERRIGLIGGRLERRSDDGAWSWGLESAGAASGGAVGYMEVLGSVGWETAPLPDLAPGLRVGGRMALGLGGGGAVPTGGGPIAKAMLTLSARLSPTLSTGVELGTLRAGDTTLRAPHAQWWLAVELEPTRGGGSTGRLQRSEWTTTLQHYLRAPRLVGSTRPLETIGIKFSRHAGEFVYLTGQAHSAFAGGAGAYSIGLVGAGLSTASVARDWQAGIEALVGASGGGGVDTRGGALVQTVAWAGWQATPSSQWRLGVGALRSLRGPLSTPIVELAWSWSFAQAAP